jgi:hypothetical protein
MAENASAFIQWKGTDVCCDFECSCGHYAHLDVGFMYYVRCPECGTIWETPSHIEFTRVTGEFLEDEHCVVDAVRMPGE